MAKQAKEPKKYKVIALSVSGRNIVFKAGDIVDKNKLNTDPEKLVEAGFLEAVEEAAPKAAPKAAAPKKAAAKK